MPPISAAANRNKQRRSGATGHRIRCPEGCTAYAPDPLPPRILWTSKLVRALSDADLAIGRLAGEGRRLPNPHILIRLFVRREAVLSNTS